MCEVGFNSAQRFCSTQDSHKIVYRTGDFGFYLANGDLVYVGRIDRQVNVHGYRVDMNEVERVIYSQSEIKQCIVVGDTNEKSKKTLLITYYVLSDTNFSEETLLSSLKKKLPAHMMPAIFIKMDKIPLTPIGKVDSEKLPDWRKIKTNTNSKPPVNDTERRIHQIWENVLPHQGALGTEESFPSLGGDSLVAMQILSEVQKQFPIKLKFETIFQYNV